MKAKKDAMPPRPNVVKVTDPEVTGVDPEPDSEPFMLKQRTEEEVADYDKGFECGKRVVRTTTPRARLGKVVGRRLRNRCAVVTD
jgi:hypothetical protein